MELWLVRHAVAADRDEFDGPDAERPLTEKGRRRFRAFCEWLAGETPMPQVVVTSLVGGGGHLRPVRGPAVLLPMCNGAKPHPEMPSHQKSAPIRPPIGERTSAV